MTFNTRIALVEISESYPQHSLPVTVYPNRVSLSTWRGCNLKCQYCILQLDPVDADPFKTQRIASVKNLLDAYDKICSESPDVSTLKIIINDHSDPFLTPEICNDTFEIISALNERKIKAPVVITTKLYPGTEEIKKISDGASVIALSVFVSVADTSTNQRVEINNLDDRFLTLKTFHEQGVHTCAYVKPLGPWTDLARLASLIKVNETFIDEIVISPLKGDLSIYQQYGIENLSHDYDFGGKIENKLVALLKEQSPNIPVSRKRSCAINRRNKINCKPPLFGNETKEETSDLFSNSIRTNGYCELRNEKEFHGNSEIIRALHQTAIFLNETGVDWALIGSLQRALFENNSAKAVGDIDIAVSKSDIEIIHSRLRQQDISAQITKKCGGACSLRGTTIAKNTVIDIENYRTNLRFRINDIQIDISSKDESVLKPRIMMKVAGVEIPVVE